MTNNKTKKTSRRFEAVRTTRRMRMAGAALAGDHISTIAQNEALSREWVRKELASDECGQIMTGIINHQHSWVIELVSQTLKAIQEALKATRVIWSDGKMRELGPDPFARLTAAKRLIELVTAGRPTPKSPETKATPKMVTLEELEAILQERHDSLQREILRRAGSVLAPYFQLSTDTLGALSHTLQASLPVAVVMSVFAAAILFAFLMDLVKVPVFRKLQIA